MIDLTDIKGVVSQDYLDNVIQKLHSRIDELQEFISENLPNRLICGRFKVHEEVRRTDPRLWEGENAPFRSYQAVIYAQAHGWINFYRRGRNYVTSAEEVERFIKSEKKPKEIELKD